MFGIKNKKLAIYFLAVFSLFALSINCWALEVYIPHITRGENDWEDLLIVDNCNGSNQTFNVVYFDQGRILQNATYGVDAYSYSSKDLKTLEPEATCAVITYTSTELNFRLSYRYLSTNATTEFNLPNSDGATTDPTFQNVRFLFRDITPMCSGPGSP